MVIIVTLDFFSQGGCTFRCMTNTGWLRTGCVIACNYEFDQLGSGRTSISSESLDIRGSSLLWHLHSSLALLSVWILTHLPCANGIVTCSHCAPTPRCLEFLLCSTVNRLRIVIPGQHLQRNHVDICSPLVQMQVILKNMFAHYRVKRSWFFFFPFLWWEGSHAIFKTASSHNIQCFFWGNMSSLLGFAKLIMASTLWLSDKTGKQNISQGGRIQCCQRDRIQGCWTASHCSGAIESQDHYLQKKPSVTISQYYNTALQKGNYME